MRYVTFISVLAAAALSAVSCERTERQPEKPVRILAAMETAAPETRVSYTGTVYNGRERIDWSAGDRIGIVCKRSDGGATATADFVVDGLPVAEGYRSLASVTKAGGDDIYWGNGTNDFTGLCPSPRTLVPGGGGTMADLGFMVGENEAAAFIPAEQNPRWNGNVGHPRMEYAPVMAEAKGLYFSGNVEMLFQPAFNAYELHFRYEKESPIHLNSFTLSSQTEALSGRYSIAFSSSTGRGAVTDAGTLTVPDPVLSGSLANNAVSVPLDVTLGKNDEVSFTVFSLPGDHADLTISLDTDKGAKSLLLRRKNGDGLVFPSCSKAVISGLVIPNAPYLSFVTVALEPWNYWQPETGADDFVLVFEEAV